VVLKVGHFVRLIRIRSNFEIWCWRRTERIILTDNVRSEDVLKTDKKKGRKTTWIGHIFRMNSLLKHVILGKIVRRIDLKGKRGSRRKQLLHDP
jgi:hypothetical protein